MKKFLQAVIFLLLFSNLLFSQDQWYRTNGPTGGPVHTVFEKSSSKIFIGTNAGVYKSTNSGSLFTPLALFDYQIIKIAGLNNMLFGIDGNYLLLRSSDDGLTWSDITTIRLSGLYVFNGILFGTESFGGVYKSTNNGNNWTLLNNGLPTDGYQLASAGNFLYGYKSYGAGAIYRSADNGNSWSILANDLPVFDGVNSFGTFNNYLFVNVVTSAGSMVFRSSNSGVNWTKINNWDILDNVNSFVQSGSYLAASVNGKGIYRTSNRGDSWSLANTGLNNLNSILLTKGASKIYASINESFMSGSLYQSANNGGSWTELKNGLTTGNVVDMALMNNNVLAATMKGIYKSTNMGTNWSISNTDISNIQVLARKDNTSTVYAGALQGLYVSTNFGTSWAATSLSTTYVFSVSFSGDNIYAGTGFDGVYKSTDNGNTWFKTTCPLMRVVALASKGKVVYAGWRNSHGKPHGGIMASTDSGITWTDSDLPDAPVSSIGIFDNNYVIASTDLGVYRSTNYGINWSIVNSGSIIGTPTDLVTMGYGDVYVANSYGVAGSYNYGKTWELVSYGLLTKNCQVIAGDMSKLYVSPPYFGMWRLPLAKDNLMKLNNDIGAVPSEYRLAQNYPNPFNPVTKISFDLPVNSFVKIVVYDLLGRELEILVNESRVAGRYDVNFDASMLTSGVYFYKIQAGDFSDTKRMLLIK